MLTFEVDCLQDFNILTVLKSVLLSLDFHDQLRLVYFVYRSEFGIERMIFHISIGSDLC